MPQTQDIGRLFSPLQIGYITNVVEPLNASSNVDWAMEMFKDTPELDVIPIERDGAVLGVLPRRVLEQLAGSAWSKFWQKDLDAYIIPAREVLDATSYSSRIIDEALSAEREEASWFVVQHRRSYLGIVSLRGMLEYTNTLRSQDLKRASEIQQHLLQKSALRDKRFSLFFFNTMAHEIGGDFYRVYQADKDRYLVACFDVAGKNISGALTTMALGTCFSSFEQFNYSSAPENITNRINTLIKEVNPPGVFVAAILFYIDFTTRRIRIHNCGYSPVLVFVPQSDNKISYKIYNPAFPPLGIEDEYDLSDSMVVPISGGLRLCAYSDGLTDMSNIYGERYGDEQATKFIKNVHTAPHKNLEPLIKKEITGWIGTASMADDVTLVDMRFH